ncbi:MAG TPA: molecular chaperone HtpG [Cryomorphaceae bacterium]|nr:molecular chaperone HtpG [Cryomorphaceae bacterium]
MSKGSINVTAQNIFPIIKKFLYSDHEIFLRELVSNAVDATQKLKTLTNLGEAKGELGDLSIHIKLDKKAKTLSIVDRGIGMTAEEIDKYINQVAFSGAEEFVKDYEGKMEGTDLIGHFGLGFYSAFMVAKKVEILTKSHKDDAAVMWSCEGNPEFELTSIEKEDRGTEIRLHIAEDSEDFLEDAKINELLSKYAKFMPVSIEFGDKDESFNSAAEGEEAKWETKKVPNIINNPNPAWVRKPADLTEEDYSAFYRELYPSSFDEPLFSIHLNVDFPFNLTGVLYFPKIKPNVEPQRNKIQLFQKQVFVTDSVEGIVPDFLTLLHGVIDSPDIPLNVSRSYLQADGNVKKISSHITKKVADKLEEMFRNDREDFERKWNDMKIIIEYGMLTEDKFFDKGKKFALYETMDGKLHTFEAFLESIKEKQTDKDNKTVVLYASHKNAQHSYVQQAKAKGYDVLLLDSPLTSHLIQKLEQEFSDTTFARVDSDLIDNLIKKEETRVSKLSEKQKEELKTRLESIVPKEKFTLKLEDMESTDAPLMITVPEFMRRMKEMQMSGGGGMMGMGDFPDMYDLVVNANHSLASKILDTDDEALRSTAVNQALDLAKLQQNLLHGEELTAFITRSYEMLGEE